MGFWEEHKKLCYAALAAAVVLLVLWPSFKQGRPAIVRFYAPEYGKLTAGERASAKKIAGYYDKKNPRMSSVTSQAKRFNRELTRQYAELKKHVIFIPPMPFKIEPWEPNKGLKFLEIQTKAHTVDLLRYTSLPDVVIGDEFFGLNLGGVPPDPERLPLLLRQLAMIDDLVRKATDCRVRRIDRVIPMVPLKTGPLNKPHFLAVYPVRMEIAASVKSIMKFVNSLDGYHGRVTRVGTQNRREDGKVIAEAIVEIDVGRNDGIDPNYAATFTIFDDVPDAEDGLRYKGRAYVQEVQDDKCIAVIPKGALPPVDEKELEKRKIVAGDPATTNFYTLLDLKIEGTPPREKNSLTNDIRAIVTVGAVGLVEETKARRLTRPGRIRERITKPTRTWRGGY